ncbi:uncharacterized protein LOC133898943 isoform X2 [Phragmites australis]|uniref:uncharacterized protein LOC133898943 isoform X2 n=1 Tax=Phragmites australis TaxID=29695 RepID=UPI002D775502|nr:uncharacterized protein LOC133898943 isoform X2 [Phragmites australis]
MAAAFSIRAYAESLRGTAAADLGPFGFAAKDLPPMEVRVFRWWEDELAAVKAAEADEDEDEDEEAAPGKGRAPKKRSISDLFAAATPVDASDSGNAAEEDEEEALYAIMRRMKRKRRSQAAAAAAEEEETTGAEQHEAEVTFARKKAFGKTTLRLDTPEASNEPEDEHPLSTEKEKTPDLKGRKPGKTNSLQKKKADRLKYIESRKAIKVGKQRDTKKELPLHSILKKYTKHTSVKMVKEKHCSSKGTGVIELCHKSVKCVKFSEVNDALGNKKQSSKIPQLKSLCKMISDAMTSSSSSTDMSSEGDRHIVAESSCSHKPEKVFTNTKEVDENINHENYCELSNTGLSTGLFDLNQEALPESTDLNAPYVPNSEVSYLEHTQDGTFSTDQQVLDNGRENHKDLSFDPHRQEHQLHATDLDTRIKGKLPFAMPNRTVQDSVLQQNWFSMTLHQGVSQLSTGGKTPSCQCQECNQPHSEKTNFHSEMNVQQESRPALEQTVRLMGKDLTVSKTRVDYFAETAQKHRGSSTKDNLTTSLVLELPRQGQPFLSLQAQSIPIVSANSATATHVSANSASTGTTQAHFGYRSPHNFSHPLPTANVFSGEPSPYEDRFRDFTNSQSHRNVVLGRPPLPNHASSAEFLQNSPTPWRYYSDHSTRTESPSTSFFTTITRHLTPYSDYRANLPQPYGVNSASSSIHPHNSASCTWSHPDRIIQGISDSRASAALPSRNEDTGTTRAVPENSGTSSSSRYVVRSGPVKLSAGAKHILMPSENTEDDNSAPVYSYVSFGSSNGNVSAPQKKGADFRKF